MDEQTTVTGRSRRMKGLLLSLAVLVLTIGTDQLTKSIVRRICEPGTVYHVLGNLAVIVRVENSGAFLSLGAHWPGSLRLVVFIFLSAAILVAVVVFILVSRTMTTGGTLSLSLIAGGGLGNMFDRIFRNGRVTDFMNVGIGPVRTGIFNLADMYILAGIAVLFVVFLRLRRST